MYAGDWFTVAELERLIGSEAIETLHLNRYERLRAKRFSLVEILAVAPGIEAALRLGRADRASQRRQTLSGVETPEQRAKRLAYYKAWNLKHPGRDRWAGKRQAQ